MMACFDKLHSAKKKDVPAFNWFERLAHLVIREYFRRAFAPEIVKAREKGSTERAHLHDVIRNLADNVRESLRRLANWTTRFLGLAIINPFAPNTEWADEAATVVTLREAGLIGTNNPTMAGASWLKNRQVGEVVGEFFFGAATNPFRGNDLLLPKGWEDIFAGNDKHED